MDKVEQIKMTIEDLLKQLKAKEKASVKTTTVRELDEEEKGHFVAFVDEAEATYDVHIEVEEQEVKQMTCDCREELTPCIHQWAVLLQITQQGVKVVSTQLAQKSKSKAKMSKSNALLQEVSKETLAKWLAEVFKKNKTLEQQFIVTFSQEETNYTSEYVEEMMQQTFKAVAGKRKTLEGVKIKKIVDTLAIAFEPVNDFITINMDKPLALELFSTIMRTMQAFDRRIVHHSKKFEDFYQQYSTWFALTLNNMQNQGLWQTQVKGLIEPILVATTPYSAFEGILVKNIYEYATLQQQKQIAHEIAQSLAKSSQNRYDYKMDFISFIRDVALTHDFYEEVYGFFKIRDL